MKPKRETRAILRRDFDFRETVDGDWLVLCKGIQWGPVGAPRDKSGCASTTWKTRWDAELAVIASLDRRRAKG
jgi:hypothetical protein